MSCVVLLSGGMDSLVCLGLALKETPDVYVFHMNYQQKTSAKELECFHRICHFYQIGNARKKIVDLEFLKGIGGSSLTDDKMQIRKNSFEQNDIPTSYVPFRNSIILSLAVSWSEVLGSEKIYFGANHEDSPGYPDCRPEYYESFNQLIKVGTKDGKIKILTPIINLTKKKIIELGEDLRVPFDLSWSCYERTDKACGECDSCQLRLRGFEQVGKKDPISYLV